jgi:hypothetical protein
VYGREVQDHLSKIPESERKFFEDLYEKMCNIDMDLNHTRCIIDGSWPTADDYIYGARKMVALNASVPRGQKCADCQPKKQPCMKCLDAWTKLHAEHVSSTYRITGFHKHETNDHH